MSKLTIRLKKMTETLTLTAQTHKKGRPDQLEAVVEGREGVSSFEDPNNHDLVYTNHAWINVAGLNLRRLDHIFPGGEIMRGESGDVLHVITQERWRKNGELVRAIAEDPRPVTNRRQRFAVLTS